ncbi:MAG: T9SS type A sorting domain-containing protein [Lewinellaceae bacterium]|nr:T9SS type A sorting domain-containing protein [Lewinellaceae bacterium]MCB9286182.1 T9SS type A sorting domain-containing protein [Lewinellaceae bacterium]
MTKYLHAIFAFAFLFGLQGNLLAQPANDECADAIAVDLGSHDFSTVDATTGVPGFPQNCPSDDSSSDSLYNDIWYTYTAGFTGMVQFSTCGMADYDTNLAVYGPNAPCPPTDDDLVDCSEDAAGCSGFSSAVAFDVVEGETYLLRIGGWGGSSPGEEGSGTFTLLEYTPPSGPPNDDCENAIELVLNANDSTFVEFESINANNGPPEHLQPALCFEADETNVYKDLWYSWTATFTDGLEWSNCGTTNFDSRMAVYESDVCPPDPSTLVGCSDDGVDENAVNCPGYTSRALFNVEEGKTYLFRLGGFANGDAGDGTFYVRRIPLIVPPENDPCDAPNEARIITEEEADNFDLFFEGNTAYASGQPEYPNPVCRNDGEFWDVWYSFNSGNNTEVTLRFNKVTLNAEFIIDIFESCGTPADSSWCVRSDEQNNSYFDQTFTGFPGEPTEYLIRISTQVTNDAPGNFWFQLVGIPYSGLEELKVENFRFYPNPVNDQANMSFRMKEALDSQVEVVNALGQMVQRLDFGILPAGEQNLSFSTAGLKPGVYFLRLLADGRQKTIRFVKQ